MYLAFCLQIGKVSVPKFGTVERCLRYRRLYGKIDARPADNTLIDFVVTVVVIRIVTGPLLPIVANLNGREFLFYVNRILGCAGFFGQRFGRRSDDLRGV